jgi:protein NrfC
MQGNPMNCEQGRDPGINRRDFIKVTGAIILVAGTGGCKPSATDKSRVATDTSGTGGALVTADAVLSAGGIPPADGYLLVDIEKCQGCVSCMLACSLIHEGAESLSLSRIQVMQNPFETFPDDLTIEQCRQCADPACVKVCPTGALKADARYGHVRMVAREECIGCGACLAACPYTPSRAFLAADKAYGGEAKSRKCDLCANAPYHWDEAGGGPDGNKACVEVCPVGAISFTKKIPKQNGDGGYKVDLRGRNWGKLGYPAN